MSELSPESNPVDRAVIRVTSHLTIEAYQFPDGEIRYSVEGVCELFGLDSQYLADLRKRPDTTWHQLLNSGFTGEIVEASVDGDRVRTLSQSDVVAFGLFAASNLQRLKARALIAASFAEILEGGTREAFELPAQTIDERMAEFESQSDRASISDARAALDDLDTDSRYYAPFDDTWSLRDLSGPFLVHNDPWD
jgi:hypothetical protein